MQSNRNPGSPKKLSRNNNYVFWPLLVGKTFHKPAGPGGHWIEIQKGYYLTVDKTKAVTLEQSSKADVIIEWHACFSDLPLEPMATDENDFCDKRGCILGEIRSPEIFIQMRKKLLSEGMLQRRTALWCWSGFGSQSKVWFRVEEIFPLAQEQLRKKLSLWRNQCSFVQELLLGQLQCSIFRDWHFESRSLINLIPLKWRALIKFFTSWEQLRTKVCWESQLCLFLLTESEKVIWVI